MISGLLSGLLWALDTLVIGLVLGHPSLLNFEGAALLAPLISTGLHDAASALWMKFFRLGGEKKRSFFELVKTRSGKFILLASLIAGPIGMSAYVISIQQIGPALSAVLTSLYPAFTAVFSFFFLKEKLKNFQVLGLGISLVGITLLNVTPGSGGISGAGWGLIFPLLTCVSWGLEGVIVSYGMQKEGDNISDSDALFIRQTTSALAYLLVIFPIAKLYKPVLAALTVPQVGGFIVAAALFGTASYLFYYRSIYQIGPVKAVPLNVTYVAWLIVFNALFLSDPLSGRTILFSAMMVLGAVLTATNDLSELKFKS